MRRLLAPLAVLAVAATLVIVTVILGAVLDGNDGWTQATAAAGLAATVVAAALLLGSSQGWVNGRRLSLAAVSTAVVGLGAVALAVVTYVGGASDAGVGGTDEAIVQETTHEGAALSQQVSNNEVQAPGEAHDPGKHPTFTQFMSLDTPSVLRGTPGGTLTPPEVTELKDQLAQVRAFALAHDTVEKAQAAGFFNTTPDVPFMGAHYINANYIGDGVFDPTKPEGLLFSKRGDDTWELVGVWFLLFPGFNPGVTRDIPPQGFAGNLDLWHEHEGLCGGLAQIREKVSQEECAASGQRFIGDIRWMMHVWVMPETADNPEGVFTYLNSNLFNMQSRVQAAP